MRIWRITKERYAASAFTGSGAADHPGRWNQRGRKVAYASDCPALAMLEVLVNAESFGALAGRVIISGDVPDEFIYRVPDADLPATWRQFPIPRSTRELGEGWLRNNEYLAMSVPSAVMPLHRNVLINPEHELFGKIEFVEPFPLDFDPRLTEFR